jgi:hypothetical protein
MDYFIFKDEQQYGPYSETQIEEMLSKGSLPETVLYWSDGMSDWRPVSERFRKHVSLVAQSSLPIDSDRKDTRISRPRNWRLSAIIITILLGCGATTVLFFTKLIHSNLARPRNPKQQFQQFEHPVGQAISQDSGDVGGLVSGMTSANALRTLQTSELPWKLSPKLEQQFRFEVNLPTGDTLKAIIAQCPKQLPSEIEGISLGFFNDELFSVTYIYRKLELLTIVPKEEKYARNGDQWGAKKSKADWEELTTSIISAANKKYVRSTLDYPNFFCESTAPQQVGSSNEKVLFHGISSVAVANIEYAVEREFEIGALDSDRTISELHEIRVVVASFYFLDCARKHALDFYDRKCAIAQKVTEQTQRENREATRRQVEAESKAGEEKRRKAEQFGKTF